MKQKFLRKAVSLTAAAAIGCSSLIGTGLPLPAAAAQPQDAVQTTDTAPVPVIVKVTGKPILTTAEGAAQGDAFLTTPEAVRMADTLENTQTFVQREIRRLYPELAVRYSYSVLYNGFSCELPENLIGAVEELPFVESVSRVTSHASPRMASASGLGGYPAYYDFTGCTGEGKVIAVIDSELDVTHPMFSKLADTVKVSLTEKDIEEIASGIGFNVDIDPSLAYRSNKLPFVIDYVDEDPYGDVAINDMHPNSYHGTHVSGIAAGNEFTDENGTKISGIAKDAQIVFMAAETAGSGFLDDSIVAALEDAVKLHADVINMSFGSCGERFEDNPLKEVYAAAENAGITICLAAGNDDNGSSFGEVHTAQNPDTSRMNSETVAGAGILTVASADNNTTLHNKGFLLGEESIPYGNTIRSDDETVEHKLCDLLSGEYEYVYCGDGMEADFAQHDLEGKIALVNRTDFWLQKKAVFAQKAGAVGIINIFQEGLTPVITIFDNDLPAGTICYEDGQKLLNADVKKITISDEIAVDMDVPTAVSDYTSWGVANSLELRPDIMGVGGNVESANYEGGTSVMSGTSMATPYLAGCSAVLDQYLEKKGIKLEGAEKLRYMRNLLMTSAVPYMENEMFVTPRRQGAGLVSLNNVLSDKVLLTGKEGESKIQLRDKVGDSFDFELNLRNISEEDVSFKSARLVLTTDDSVEDEVMQVNIIDGQRPLDCTADLSKLLHIGAGEERSETVSVALNAAQTAEIRSIFTNGFFVEGYLLLEGAENCCDISVPLLGFAGDWAKLPVLDESSAAVVMSMGDGPAIQCGYSVAKLSGLLAEIMPQIPEKELADPDADLFSLLLSYASEEQMTQLLAEPETFYISPNADGMADDVGLSGMTFRYGWYNGLNIYDENGKLVVTGEESSLPVRYMPLIGEPSGSMETLADGSYTGSMSFSIDYGEGKKAPQTFDFPFIVDTKAPVVKTDLREENGRMILTLSAADDALEGVYISGKGKGGIFGKYDPQAEQPGNISFDSLSAAAQLLQMQDSLSQKGFDSSTLPLFAKLLTGTADFSDSEGLDFSDVIAAVPDENGTFTLEYDITDLSSYTISVTDQAFNFTSLESEAAEASVQPGIYRNDRYLYSFTDSKVRRADLMNGEIKEFESDSKASFTQITDGKIRFVPAEGSAEVLNYVCEGDLEDYPFYTGNQITKRVTELFAEAIPQAKKLTTKTFIHNGIATVAVRGTVDSSENTSLGYCRVDMNSGEIVEDPMNFVSAFPLNFKDMTDDTILMEVRDGHIFYYNFDAGVCIAQDDRSETKISFALADTALTMTIDGKERKADYDMHGGSMVTISWEDGTETVLEPVTAASVFRFYDNKELLELVLNYSEAKNGKRPETAKAEVQEDGLVKFTVSEEEIYFVSPIGANGYDNHGEEFDLTQSLEPMKDPFTSGVWFAPTECGRYFIFDGNQNGEMRMLDGSYQASFTYEMTANGALLTIGPKENGMTQPVSLFPQEDGTLIVSWQDGTIEHLTYLKDKKADTLKFYTTGELTEMSDAHIPLQGALIETSPNEDGTVSVFISDETGNMLDVLTLDPTDGTGTNMNGESVDVKERYVPALPEEATAADDLKSQALVYYAAQHSTPAANAEALVLKDGTVRITLTDATGKVLTTYTVDPVTTIGTDRTGRIMQFSAPALPENAVSESTLKLWAQRDYAQKNGKMPTEMQYIVNADGTVTIQLMTEVSGHYSTADVYTIDPVTGKGFDQNGAEVDLPQTGNNTPETAGKAAAAVMMLIAGAFAAVRSGFLRKKHSSDDNC